MKFKFITVKDNSKTKVQKILTDRQTKCKLQHSGKCAKNELNFFLMKREKRSERHTQDK